MVSSFNCSGFVHAKNRLLGKVAIFTCLNCLVSEPINICTTNQVVKKTSGQATRMLLAQCLEIFKIVTNTNFHLVQALSRALRSTMFKITSHFSNSHMSFLLAKNGTVQQEILYMCKKTEFPFFIAKKIPSAKLNFSTQCKFLKSSGNFSLT